VGEGWEKGRFWSGGGEGETARRTVPESGTKRGKVWGRQFGLAMTEEIVFGEKKGAEFLSEALT